MKRILSISFCLFIFCTGFSQRYRPGNIHNYQRVDEKWLHFGFTLGINEMDFALYNSGTGNAQAEQVVFSPGFTVGIVSDLRLHEDLSFRFLPGLEFGERIIHYSNLPVDKVKVESVLINLPLLLKYKAKRLDNFRPYLIGGTSYKYDVQAQSSLDPDESMLIRLKTSDFHFEFGAGIDFYMTYFKLSTELKLSIGLSDIINHQYDVNNPGNETYTDVIQGLNSKILTLSFHFE